jgi:hypothetical protein
MSEEDNYNFEQRWKEVMSRAQRGESTESDLKLMKVVGVGVKTWHKVGMKLNDGGDYQVEDHGALYLKEAKNHGVAKDSNRRLSAEFRTVGGPALVELCEAEDAETKRRRDESEKKRQLKHQKEVEEALTEAAAELAVSYFDKKEVTAVENHNVRVNDAYDCFTKTFEASEETRDKEIQAAKDKVAAHNLRAGQCWNHLRAIADSGFDWDSEVPACPPVPYPRF